MPEKKQATKKYRVVAYAGVSVEVEATGWVCTDNGHLELFRGTDKVAEFSRGNWFWIESSK